MQFKERGIVESICCEIISNLNLVVQVEMLLKYILFLTLVAILFSRVEPFM